MLICDHSRDLDIPPGTRPPNPEESEREYEVRFVPCSILDHPDRVSPRLLVLPSVVHPSYLFGNSSSTKHPAPRPKRPFEPSSCALFEDVVPLGAGVNGFLQWKELGLDTLLPVDEEAEKKTQAEQAWEMTNGAPVHQKSSGPLLQPADAQRRTAQTETGGEGDEEDTVGDSDDDDGGEEEAATKVDDGGSLGTDSQDLLSSDYYINDNVKHRSARRT